MTIPSVTAKLAPSTLLQDAITQLARVLKHSSLTKKLHFQKNHRQRYLPSQCFNSVNHIYDGNEKKQTLDKFLQSDHAKCWNNTLSNE